MRTYLIELRRNPIRWWTPLFVLVVIAVLFGRETYWIGVWPEAAAAAQVPNMFLAPIVAAAAAYASSRRHRRETIEQESATPKSPFATEAPLFASTLTYAVGIYFLGQLVAAIASYSEAGPGFLWWEYVVMGATVIIASAGLGHGFGRVFPSAVYTPVIVGMAVYSFIAFFDHSLGIFVLSGSPDQAVAGVPVLARLMVAIGVCLLAVSIYRFWRRTFHLTYLAPIALSIAVFMGGIYAVSSTGDVISDREAVDDPLCTDTDVQICMWPEHIKYYDDLEAIAERTALLPDELDMPDLVFERGLDLAPEDSDDLGFMIISGSMRSATGGVVASSFNQTFDLTCDEMDFTDEMIEAYGELRFWVESVLVGGGQRDYSGGPPDIDMDAIEDLVDNEPFDSQLEWAEERIEFVKDVSCAS